MNIDSAKGTYILVFSNSKKRNIKVGQLGNVTVEKGYYLYVGSAFGPGGFRARVCRHLKKKKTPYWHIDYLRSAMIAEEIWFTLHPEKLECHWSRMLNNMQGHCFKKGLGSSDCSCESHFYHFSSKPDVRDFQQLNSEKITRESLNKSP